MNPFRVPDHPPDEQLVAWREVATDLPAPLAQALGDHLAACRQCAARLDQLAAVERSLQAWRASAPAPPVAFTAQVLAALPSGLYPRLTWGAWARQQFAGVGCMLAGAAALVLAGDTLGLAAGWWQALWLWVGNGGAADTADLTTWLSNAPATSPESYLALLPGAILLGLGALRILVGNLRAPAAQPA